MVVAIRCPVIRFAEYPGSNRFFVRGSDGTDLLVDLDEYDGNGWCGCEDFQFRKMGRLESGERNVLVLRCKHIQKAIKFRKLYAEIARLAENPTAKTIPQAGKGKPGVLQTQKTFPEAEQDVCGMLFDPEQWKDLPVAGCASHARQSREDAQ